MAHRIFDSNMTNEEKDYKKLYEKLVNEIENQYKYWHTKEAEQHSIEREVRWSEYGRLQAFIIGIEKDN